MMTSSDTAASAVVRRATAAFVLLSALLAIGVAVLVIIGAVQQFTGDTSVPTASALPYLFIVIPLLIVAVAVRWHLVGRPRRNI